MRILTFILMLGVLIGGISSCTHSDSDSSAGGKTSAQGEKTTAAKEVYTCPMHPSVISDKPGACPVCGMALVKKSAQMQLTSNELTAIQQVSFSPTQRVVANVSTTPVRRQPLSKTVTTVGVIDYAEPQQAKVAARFRGRIEKLYVNFTGDLVHQKQPLFELYSPDLVSAEQEVILAAQAAANVVSTDGDFTNREQLLQAARERLRIHFGMTTEQIAEVEKSQRARSTVTFYSPIHGTVIQKNIQEGQYVDEGMLLYQLADLSKVWIYLDVYEKDARFVTVGQRVSISSEAYPDETFMGRVTFVSPVLDADTRTVRVRTEFTNPDSRLKPQMYVKASIDVPRGDALVVPASAVLSTGRRNVVWVEVKPNTFEPRNVMLGIHTDAICEVLNGLTEGESVVSSGGFLVESESQLQQPTGAKSEPAFPGMAHDASEPSARSEHVVKIHVNQKYTPNVIRVKEGETVKLAFYRDENSECTSELVIEGLNVHRTLPAMQTTTIELTPKKKGQYRLVCGMGMEQGKLIVE